MLRVGQMDHRAGAHLVACFATGWKDQKAIQNLAALGHGHQSAEHFSAPTQGVESVQGWIRCLLGREDDPDDRNGTDLVRVRRWLSWVPQPGHARMSVLDLIRKANAGDTAAKFRLMGVGGVETGSLAWVERTGNEAFRQSENMAEWVMLMQEMGISPIICANFLVGLPLDGMVRAEDRTSYNKLGLAVEVLWATGLFLTPLDLVEVLRPAKVRLPAREDLAEVAGSKSLPGWSAKSLVAEWSSQEDFLTSWAQTHFLDQRLLATRDLSGVLAATHATKATAQNHLYPDLVRRASMQSTSGWWGPKAADQTIPEFCTSAERILVV